MSIVIWPAQGRSQECSPGGGHPGPGGGGVQIDNFPEVNLSGLLATGGGGANRKFSGGQHFKDYSRRGGGLIA